MVVVVVDVVVLLDVVVVVPTLKLITMSKNSGQTEPTTAKVAGLGHVASFVHPSSPSMSIRYVPEAEVGEAPEVN